MAVLIKAYTVRGGEQDYTRFDLKTADDLIEVLEEGATLAVRGGKNGVRYLVYQAGYRATPTTQAAVDAMKVRCQGRLEVVETPNPQNHRTITWYRLKPYEETV